MFGFDLFKSKDSDHVDAKSITSNTWNPTSLTMEQPRSPAAPTNQQIVSEQPPAQEQMQLRGGSGKGDICCGVCAGLACFECCEICC